MVSPAWFYSTIAQASAAIIGLTIAFTISTHLSRRERRRRRTDKAREEALELKQKYQPLLDTISEAVRDCANLDPDSVRYELDDVDDVELWASDMDAPISARVWALTSGMSNILSEYSRLSGKVSHEQITTLHDAVQELEYGLLYRNGGPDEELYTEITDQEPNDADSHYYFDDILDEHGRIESWLERHRRAREENLIATTPEDLTGKNLFSLATIMEILDDDLTVFGFNSVESDLTSDFLETDYASYVLEASLRLAIYGIFLPMMLLISAPDGTLPTIVIGGISPIFFDMNDLIHLLSSILIQAVILVFSVFYTLRLFTIMTLDMRTAVPTMSDLLGTATSGNLANETDQNTPDGRLATVRLGFHKMLLLIQYLSLPNDLRDQVKANNSE